jgi:hypothetical protein
MLIHSAATANRCPRRRAYLAHASLNQKWSVRAGVKVRAVDGRYPCRTPKGGPMQLAVLACLGATVGVFGYCEAMQFQLHYRARPWRLRPLVWAVLCLMFGPIGALIMVVAQARTRKALPATLVQPDVSSPPPLRAPHLSQLRPPAPTPPPQRHWVPHQQPPSERPLRTPRPQRHPTDARKLYLFGIPAPQGQLTGPSAFGLPESAHTWLHSTGGTDLLPNRPPRHLRPRTRRRARELR